MRVSAGRNGLLERVVLLIAVSAAYVVFRPRWEGAVFMDVFNNLDGSLLVVWAVSAAVDIALFFTVAFRLFPTRLEVRQVLCFLVASAAVVAIGCLGEDGLRLVVRWLFNLPFGPDAFSDKQIEFPAHASLDPAVLPHKALAAAGGAVYGIARDWVIKNQRARRLEVEKMRAEIALLRSQINPHYFFNTLNNIYAVAERRGDDEVGRAILRLSETMRYVIYDGQAEAIPVSREIDHIGNTIDVFRLRFAPDEQPDVTLTTAGDLETLRIAPLLLVPFVENALKHGLDSLGRGRVAIDVRRDGWRLDVQIENTRAPARDAVRAHHGVGLANVRRRLELLYPGRHALDIEETTACFRVRLTLRLEGSQP